MGAIKVKKKNSLVQYYWFDIMQITEGRLIKKIGNKVKVTTEKCQV